MTKAFEVLPPSAAQGIDNHQIIEMIHRLPPGPGRSAIILIGVGALTLTTLAALIARRRAHHRYAQGYIDGIEYRHLSGTTETGAQPSG